MSLKPTVSAIIAAATLIAVPGAAQATSKGTEEGNSSTGCSVRWEADAILDRDKSTTDPAGLWVDREGNPVDYSNGGYLKEVSPLFGDAGKMEMQHWTDGQRLNFRLYIGSEHAITNGKVDVTLPEGFSWSATDDTAWGAEKYSPAAGLPYTVKATPVPSVNGSKATIDLGEFKDAGVATVTFTAPLNGADPDGEYIARSTLTGTFTHCQTPLPATTCTEEFNDAGVGHNKVLRKSNDTLAYEIYQDRWSANSRLGFVTTQALQDVVIKLSAPEGETFTVDSMATPAWGAVPNWYRATKIFSTGVHHGYQAGIEIEKANIPHTLSDDGKTLILNIGDVKANSSFSMNLGVSGAVRSEITGRRSVTCAIPAKGEPTKEITIPGKPAVTKTVTIPGKPAVTKTVVTPGKPAVNPVIGVFQVDQYTVNTAARARAVVKFDDDNKLGYREDRIFWGASKYRFVTVTALDVKKYRTVQRALAAKSGLGTPVANVTSARVGTKVTKAWKLGRGATTRAAWGPRLNVAQVDYDAIGRLPAYVPAVPAKSTTVVVTPAVPSKTQTVTVTPAVPSRTETVPNPDYVPGTDAVSDYYQKPTT